MPDQPLKLTCKIKRRLAKFDGHYEKGKEPIEVIEWDDEIPIDQALKILENRKNGTR